MLDTRKGLEKGTILLLDKEYEIQKEIARGGSCLVYEAFYNDFGRHRVRIKECFPYYIIAERDIKGTIVPIENLEKQFEDAKAVFQDAYKTNICIRENNELTNATIDSILIHEKNNTWYCVMSYIEGEDYKKFQESCLKDIFTRMKKFCKIIKIYHDKGWLLLDIKPENIWIPLDTREQVVLFDFDSLVDSNKLNDENEVRISCSGGFSAPELVRGDGRIGKMTDIFSIGAVIFFKMFGKTPGYWERGWDANYNYEESAFPDERYQPRLFYELTKFFHKTISSSRYLRYQDMGEVITALEELEKLSDVEGMMLLDSFSYSFSQFVGRENEILQIKEILDEKDCVFLSGMGGIGKTELAKKFANMYRDQFHRIVFLRFTDSIMETVCSEELAIAGCDIEEQETFSHFCDRKLKILKQIVSKDDLIILDNFDSNEKNDTKEDKERLKKLLNCGCKFLITTRECFWSDNGREQIDIGPLKNDFEYKELFLRNNSKEYSESEWEAIRELFNLFENHTMTITLFAKYLLHTEQMPSELLPQMKQKEGIASAKNVSVRVHKDDEFSKRKIYIHLENLFDMSGFTELEMEIMRSLSLLGSVRIKKSIFVQYFKLCSGMEDSLEELIEYGWVENNVKTEKISLHQIILDLAYNSLKPSSENCPNITRAMISYFKREEKSYADVENQRRLAGYFIERIGGSDFLLAELYYEYCWGIKYEEKILKRSQKICKEVDSFESDILMVKIHHLEIKSLIQKIDWQNFEDERMGKIFNDVPNKVFDLEMKIFANLRNAILRKETIPKRTDGISLPEIANGEQHEISDIKQSIQEIKERIKEYEKINRAVFENYIEDGYPLAPYVDDTLVCLYLKTANTVETLGNRICDDYFLLDESEFLGLKSIYLDAEQIYLYTCKLAEQEFISYEVKKDVYEKLRDFYLEDDIWNSFRTACVGDESKSAYYSEKITALSGEDSWYLNKEIISYMDAAHQARFNKRYEDALALCQKAMKRKKGYIVDIQCEMSRSYIELNEYEKAETLLLEALEDAVKSDICAVFERMVELYESWENAEKVVEYCERLVQNQKYLAEEGDIMAITRVLTFSIKKAKWEGDGEIKLKEKEYLIWNKYFRILNNCQELDSMLVEPYCEYAKYCWETEQTEEALKLLFAAAEKYKEGFWQNSEARELYECILRDERFWQIRKDLYARSVLGDAENYAKAEDAREAARLCRYAEELLKKDVPDSEYIEALLGKVEIDIYRYLDYRADDYNDDEYMRKRKRCNYYLLTERKLEERNSRCSAFDEWKDAVDDYMYIDNYDMAKQCLERMEQEAERDGSMSCFETYYSRCFELDRKEGDKERLIFHTKTLYGKLIQYVQRDIGVVDDALCLRILKAIRDNAFEYTAYDTALYVGLLSVSFLLDEQWMSKMQVEKDLLEDEILLKYYISRVEEFFPKKIEKDKLDDVLRVIDKMLAGLEGNAEFKEFHTKLSEIGKRYRTEQIEFK